MCGIFAVHGDNNPQRFTAAFDRLSHRGPDARRIYTDDQVFLGFHRLAIMDLSDRGMQPFTDPNNNLHSLCNGEIYNYKALRNDLKNDWQFSSTSDCEVLLPLIEKHGIVSASRQLDGEFAFVVYDRERQTIMAGRDPIGIRPLFYAWDLDGRIGFASEAKALTEHFKIVLPFPPGHVFNGDRLIKYRSMTDPDGYQNAPLAEISEQIKTKLQNGVVKRLASDAPLGFLLSGGLDSSLVCAIAAKHSKVPIKTFAVGCRRDAIDTKYASQVAEHIGSDHTNVYFSIEEVLAKLEEVIYAIETWDITTVRASIGMYLVCEHIKHHTDIKVLLTGEISDELFGYKYTDFAPSANEFQKESKKRVDELYQYDVLRADRCLSAHALEARVPFGDLDFVDYVMSIHPEIKMNRYGVGKYLLRHAFADTDLLDNSILFREKAAFSDAVGHSMVDEIKLFAETSISDQELAESQYSHGQPFTKESLLYRRIFERHFPGQGALIKDYWMPNQTWQNCQVNDPSARALPNYGASGQ